jgi:hemoglobin/transferrin/lactoferrin receptor protein
MYQARMNPEDLALNERGDFSYAIDENGDSYTPEWYTLNIKAAYFFNKHLSMTMGVENITNQLYRTAGSGISASGRNFLISVKTTF